MRFICVRYPKYEMTVTPDIRREVNGEVLKTPRHVINFVDGSFETTDEKEIAFIKRHVDFGNGNIVTDESEKFQVATPEESKIIDEDRKHRGRPRKSV